MPSSIPRVAETQRRQKLLLFDGNWESFILDRVVKPGHEKDVGFRYMEMRKIDMSGRRNIVKDIK